MQVRMKAEINAAKIPAKTAAEKAETARTVVITVTAVRIVRAASLWEMTEGLLRREQAQAELQQQLNTAATEHAELDQQLSELQQQLEEADQKTQDAVRVSELLHKAMAADERGRLEKLQELLEEIEPLEDLLSETEREIYEELKIA